MNDTELIGHMKKLLERARNVIIGKGWDGMLLSDIKEVIEV